MKQIIKISLLFIILFFVSFDVFAQQMIIQIAGSNGKAFLFELSGEKIVMIDSVNSSDGVYRFLLNSNKHHSGLYRLTIKNSKWLDFIYDIEEIEIETDANNLFDNLKVIKSESNKIFYEFVKLNKNYKTQSELLQLVLAHYPKEDEYYKTTKEKLIQVQKEYLHFVNVTVQVEPNSFIARYVRSAHLSVIDSEIPFDKQLTYLKTYALDEVDFNDDGLIYSDAFTNKTIEYLTYYRNPQLPMGLLEKEFEVSIDTILNKAKVNDIVYKHIVEYLLDGFKKFGFDNVINYIVENYVIKDDLCLDEKLETALERRMQQSKIFKISNTVPNIIMPDSTDLLIELNKINSEKTLIIFYASWCPHCKTLLPQIYELYKNQKVKKFEILAVSIDTSRTDWLNFVRTNKLDWLSVSDLKGWAGKAVLDYFIYATPTMFLVDGNMKLIGMPKTVEELRAFQ